MQSHATSNSAPPSAIVIGGGLAGIAAAVQLSQRGVAVTLVETRKRLGGRATSFVDPTTGQVLDNCQHVLLGCCTNLVDLYEHLGVADRIEWHSKLYFCTPDGAGRPVIDVMEADDLPAPLHMTRALLGFRGLSWREKLAIAHGMLALMCAGRSGRARWAERTFQDWLVAHGQPAGAIQKFWAVVAISALNELPERMAADYAMQVFQEGFLAHEQAYLMGLAAVPLVELYDAAERVITAAGGRVQLSTSAEALLYEQGRVSGLRLADGQILRADGFVSALPFDRLARLCPAEMLAADARLRGLGQFEVSPILGIHLWLARPDRQTVMDLPHLILTEGPLQWIFNKGPDDDGQTQHLHGVVSAAHDLVSEPAARVTELALAEVRQVLPRAREAQLVHSRVVKEKRATFSIAPGLDAFRPAARGAIPNLYLAGDWCQTGWPATMEGAVRSGYLAAQALLSDRGLVAPPTVPDLPASPFYRLVAGSDSRRW